MNVDRSSRGRPHLDAAETGHAPRLAVRMPDRLHRQLHQRAAEEGRSLSQAVRLAVAAWSAGPGAAERAEIRRVVRLSDREREEVYLASNENLRRLLELAR